MSTHSLTLLTPRGDGPRTGTQPREFFKNAARPSPPRSFTTSDSDRRRRVFRKVALLAAGVPQLRGDAAAKNEE